MANKPVKIPKQLFVVSKSAPEHEYPNRDDYSVRITTEHNFGFLHAHEPHLKNDSSKKQVQFGWAYGGSHVYKVGDQYWFKGSDYDWGMRTRIHFDRPIDPEYAPRVWDNEPLTGFRIIDTVNRYRGNKLFKVLDPRGVEFEVTVASLFALLSDGEIRKGEILSPCVWKANKSLIVVG
jgi:hypothetical protein